MKGQEKDWLARILYETPTHNDYGILLMIICFRLQQIVDKVVVENLWKIVVIVLNSKPTMKQTTTATAAATS